MTKKDEALKEMISLGASPKKNFRLYTIIREIDSRIEQGGQLRNVLDSMVVTENLTPAEVKQIKDLYNEAT